jgi:hypothetical protein
MAGKLIGPLMVRGIDTLFGGQHRARGVITVSGAQARRRVIVFDRATGLPLREIWSAASGNYEAKYLKNVPQGYVIVAFDSGNNPKNAAIADLVTPEPMP